jgi:hypothetical protein
VRLPRTIALSAADYEGDGTQEMYTKITIEELTLNPTAESLGADRFSPDLHRAAIVWDSDNRHFLKHREPRMVGPEADLPLPPEQP